MSAPEILPPNAIYQGEFSVGSQLGIQFAEPEGVTYLDSPVAVYRTKTEDGDRFDAVINHAPLDGNKLFGVLAEVAPSKENSYLGGVIDDWNIVDRAALSPDVHPMDIKNSQYLVRIHQVLGESWTDFMKSRSAFLSTLEDATTPYFHRTHYKGTFMTREGIMPKLKYEFVGQMPHVSQLVDVLQGAGVDDAEERVYNALERQVNTKRRPDSQIARRDTMEKRFKSWSASQRAELYDATIMGVDEEARADVIEQALRKLYDSITFEDGEERLYPVSMLGKKSLHQIYEDRVTVPWGGHVAEVITLPGKTSPEDFVVPGTTRQLAPPTTISPLASWHRNADGQRKLIIERKIDRPQAKVVDGVLGAIAIAYFSPKERSTWPAKMNLKEAFGQEIGAAQVPVLALMRRGQLLRTDFVEACESVG
ncbi:MAG: hypothetical protein JWO41_601 [Candidatus Saccharibacteria bacterium]|nr:hypothetical protein [Candidatus Saccharibacteria bacterium]